MKISGNGYGHFMLISTGKETREMKGESRLVMVLNCFQSKKLYSGLLICRYFHTYIIQTDTTVENCAVIFIPPH